MLPRALAGSRNGHVGFLRLLSFVKREYRGVGHCFDSERASDAQLVFRDLWLVV